MEVEGSSPFRTANIKETPLKHLKRYERGVFVIRNPPGIVAQGKKRPHNASNCLTLKTLRVMRRMVSTLSVNFYCRTSKTGKDGLSPVEMAVNVNGDRFFVNLPRRADSRTFQRLLSQRQASPLREHLGAVEAALRAFETQLILRGKQVTAQAFKEFIRNGYTSPTENVGFLFEEFHTHIIDKGVSKGVVRKYEYIWELFLERTRTLPTDFLDTITKGKIRDFADYVCKSYKPSSAAGMLTKLKGVFIYGEENRIIPVNPFAGYKIKKVETDIETITEEEYKRLLTVDLSECPRLARVRDLFCFSCGTGLAYCDTQKVVPEDFKVNANGQTYLQKKRAKTNVEYTVVVLPDALDIARRYEYRLPRISNQKTNDYLKPLQEKCGIKTNLTFHKARHYYCRELLNKYKFSYEIAAKCMGHNSTKQTRHYGKVFSSTVFDAFKEIGTSI